MAASIATEHQDAVAEIEHLMAARAVALPRLKPIEPRVPQALNPSVPPSRRPVLSGKDDRALELRRKRVAYGRHHLVVERAVAKEEAKLRTRAQVNRTNQLDVLARHPRSVSHTPGLARCLSRGSLVTAPARA